MNAVTDNLKPGDVIQDTYRIDALLGEGGMGATFRGRNLASDHDVAIKVISSSFASNTRSVDLFKREASLLRTIQHDAIIRYETTLQDRHGRLYLVMEYLPGQPLSHYLADGARLGSEDVLRLGRRLAGGLDAIAAVNIVHRDVAPDNILIPHDDIQSAKLIDFGLASNTVGTDKSIFGDDFAGKFSYSAPEQLGSVDGEISPRTDAYSLGLVLMKVAGLPVPGEGKGLAAGAARRTDLKVPEGRVDPALRRALESLTRADPKRRPSPVTPVFEEALANFGTPPPRGPHTQAAVKVGQARARRPIVLAASAIAVLAVAVGGYTFLDRRGDPGGGGTVQGDLGRGAVAAADPLQGAEDLIAAGDADSLNAALGALMALGGDEGRPAELRIDALLRAAAMSDPETFDPNRSPFAEPNPSMARRLYQRAADLGSQDAARAAVRLAE